MQTNTRRFGQDGSAKQSSDKFREDTLEACQQMSEFKVSIDLAVQSSEKHGHQLGHLQDYADQFSELDTQAVMAAKKKRPKKLSFPKEAISSTSVAHGDAESTLVSIEHQVKRPNIGGPHNVVPRYPYQCVWKHVIVIVAVIINYELKMINHKYHGLSHHQSYA